MGSVTRRELLTGAFAGMAVSSFEPRIPAMAQSPTAEDMERRAIAAFPFERIETTGQHALAKWRELKTAGRGSPVVLGGGQSIVMIMDLLHPAASPRSAAEILATADSIRHPQDLVKRLAADQAREREHLTREFDRKEPSELSKMFVTDSSGKLRALTNEEARSLMLREPQSPPDGDWPSEVDASPGLSVAEDILTNRPLPKVHIALVPTDDWTTIPAHLNWGGWNACPHPEYHVAALRSWRDRFSAELIGLSHDTMNLRVTRRPATREAALELAREQHVYCNDIVDQGTGTLGPLAASLMADDWWFFWWD
jgi:uncharacterized protein DUF4253